MRTTIILGLVCGFGLIYAVMFMDNSIPYFLNHSALIVVLGGTISAMMIYFSPYALRCALSVFYRLLTEKQVDRGNLINLIIVLSKKARRSGFIDLYSSAKDLGIPFLEKGLRLLADGVDENELFDILSRESDTTFTEHRTAERFFRVAGSFSPLFGILGTVMGLIAMLNNITNPAAIPAAMGMALVTTFYGIAFSALFFKPISGKIKDKNNTENQKRKIIVEGILAIYRGENSQKTKERLMTYLQNTSSEDLQRMRVY